MQKFIKNINKIYSLDKKGFKVETFPDRKGIDYYWFCYKGKKMIRITPRHGALFGISDGSNKKVNHYLVLENREKFRSKVKRGGRKHYTKNCIPTITYGTFSYITIDGAYELVETILNDLGLLEKGKGKILYVLSKEEKENRAKKFLNTFFTKEEYEKYKEEITNPIFLKNLGIKRKYDEWSSDLGINPKAMVAIYAYVRKYKPEVLLETGVHYGLSSSIILYALKQNQKGHLISIGYWNNKDHGSYVSKSLKDRWTFIKKKTEDAFKTENILQNIKLDFFMHDSDHSYKNMYKEFEWAIQHLKENHIIFSHDIGANNSFFDFAENYNLEWFLVRTAPPAMYGMGVMRLKNDNL